MDCCLMLPVSWKRKCRPRYEALNKEGLEESVTVIVGKEKRVFEVDPYVLEERPFRVLMETNSHFRSEEGAIFVNVEAILFEHMLWLTHNDLSCWCKLSWKDIIDFYVEYDYDS